MQRPRTIYLLRRAQLWIQSRLEEALSGQGLTPTQYTVLSLSDRGEGEALSSAQLARRAGVSSQSMNEVVGALQRKGLIEREEAPENRRILRTRLTAEGRRLLDVCEAAVDALEGQMLAGFAPDEVQSMRDGLQKIVPPARRDS